MTAISTLQKYNSTSLPGDNIEVAFASFFYVILAIIIILGNTLVITAFATDRRLRTTTNEFLVGLAVSDLLVGVISIPIWIYLSICQLDGSFTTNIPLEMIFSTMDVFSGCSSVLQLTAIGIERYFAITQPVNHRTCNKRVYHAIILIIWVYSFVIAGLYPVQRISHWGKEYTLVVFTTCCAVPGSIILFVYVRIFQAARNATRNRVHPERRCEGRTCIQAERKIAATIAIITLLFLFAWLPFYVATMVAIFCSNCLPNSFWGVTRLVRFVKWMHFCNSAVNPAVYAYRNVDMRRAFLRIIKASNICDPARPSLFRTSWKVRHPFKKGNDSPGVNLKEIVVNGSKPQPVCVK